MPNHEIATLSLETLTNVTGGAWNSGSWTGGSTSPASTGGTSGSTWSPQLPTPTPSPTPWLGQNWWTQPRG
jgi:hypothetical protein